MTNTFLYFAYGSNMSVRRLQTRTPSASAIGPAEISGYKLVFDKWSRDGSAKADCEKTGNSSDLVLGGLFQIDDSQRSALDKAEGRGMGYDVVDLVVSTAAGPVMALTYVATDKRPGLTPYGWYLEHVLTGAKEFGLPENYIQSIAGLCTQQDPNSAREAKELAIYASR